ncbi:tautomerase family protein [Methylorubrum thiocyanatum]|uniref:tautomerase family protein n=1 Tax=Methylorubrum thiocyanatum TaxID=47958 RepID=UPI003F8065B2
MPFVRIMLKAELGEPERRDVAEAVHRALVENLGIPPGDRFQAIEFFASNIIYDKNYLGISRSDNFIIIQIYMATGRSVEKKQQLYKGLAKELCEHVGFRVEDVFINLVEVPLENWSFGNGEAQYVQSTPTHIS